MLVETYFSNVLESATGGAKYFTCRPDGALQP